GAQLFSPHSRRKPGSISATAEPLTNGSGLAPGMRLRVARPKRARKASRSASGGEWRASQRDIVVLLPRVLQLLAAQHRQRAAQAPPRYRGLDYVVDKAAARRDKRVGEFLAVFLRARLDRGGVGEIGAEDDLDRAFRSHHRDLGRGPGEIDVAPQMFRAHDVIS